MTLAIGDGANDINMIQSAHIGIGIMGKEGNQASSFADYAVPKFKDLRRLLFWHGRSFGQKIAIMIMIGLYKSLIHANGIFFLQTVNGHSGVHPVEAWIYSMYDLCLTQLAYTVMIFGVDIAYKYAQDETQLPFKISRLYLSGRVALSKFKMDYIRVLMSAFMTGAVMFIVYRQSHNSSMGIRAEDGKVSDVYAYGLIVVIAGVCLNHIYIMIHITDWTLWYTVWFVVSVMVLPANLLIAQSFYGSELYNGIWSEIILQPVFILENFLICSVFGLYWWSKKVIRVLFVEP
jgi:magnesium-transporting ATPase (P-type)